MCVFTCCDLLSPSCCTAAVAVAAGMVPAKVSVALVSVTAAALCVRSTMCRLHKRLEANRHRYDVHLVDDEGTHTQTRHQHVGCVLPTHHNLQAFFCLLPPQIATVCGLVVRQQARVGCTSLWVHGASLSSRWSSGGNLCLGVLCLSHPLLCFAVLCCAVLFFCPPTQRVNRKAMSSLLQSTLEAVVDVDKFPKAAVDVNVLVLQVSTQGRCRPVATSAAAIRGVGHTIRSSGTAVADVEGVTSRWLLQALTAQPAATWCGRALLAVCYVLGLGRRSALTSFVLCLLPVCVCVSLPPPAAPETG